MKDYGQLHKAQDLAGSRRPTSLSVNVHVFVSPKHSTVLDSPVSC